MKRNFIYFVLVLFCNNLFSQITITNATFPSIGDTLKTQFRAAPNIDYSQQGGPHFWDLGNLSANNINRNIFVDPKSLDSLNEFPTANLAIRQDGFTAYFKKTNTTLERIGEKGNFGGGNGLEIPVVIRIKPVLIERRAPMKFFDVNNTSYARRFSFSTKFIPDSLLGGAANLIDSLRVNFSANRIDVVEAFGKMKLNGKEFSVLKEKRTEYTDTKLEAKTPFGWIDLTNLLGSDNEILNSLGKDTIIRYYFFNDKEKEPIAIVTKQDTFTNIEYKSIILSSVEDYEVGELKILGNPTKDHVGINFGNIENGNYTVEFISVGSGQVHYENINIVANDIQYFDLRHLPAGNVFVQLTKKQQPIARAFICLIH